MRKVGLQLKSFLKRQRTLECLEEKEETRAGRKLSSLVLFEELGTVASSLLIQSLTPGSQHLRDGGLQPGQHQFPLQGKRFAPSALATLLLIAAWALTESQFLNQKGKCKQHRLSPCELRLQGTQVHFLFLRRGTHHFSCYSLRVPFPLNDVFGKHDLFKS